MANQFRLIRPIDQAPLNEVTDTQVGATGESSVVSQAWLGQAKVDILDARELANFMEGFRNDPNTGNRFYVERIVDPTER